MLYLGVMVYLSLFQLEKIVALWLDPILQSTEGHCTGKNRKTSNKPKEKA
jgi:hypothetical protein